MINRKHRFHGHGSLRFVYQNGRTIRGQYGSIKYIANPRRKDYRLAVVVSRKVHKSAVVRNRIRRRIYEIVRREEHRITGAYDMVMTVFSDQCAYISAEDLRQRVVGKMEEAGIVIPEKTDVSKPDADSHAIVKVKEN